jgi:hypothetical protein
MAMSMSTTDRIPPAELPAIRRRISSVAAHYGLRARLEGEDGRVTIRFDRRRDRGAD